MDALRKFTDAGNHFCINTGRAIDSAKAVYNGLGLNFKGSFLCGSNGTEIYSVDEGRYIYKTGVELSLVPRILDLADEYGVEYDGDVLAEASFQDMMVSAWIITEE